MESRVPGRLELLEGLSAGIDEIINRTEPAHIYLEVYLAEIHAKDLFKTKNQCQNCKGVQAKFFLQKCFFCDFHLLEPAGNRACNKSIDLFLKCRIEFHRNLPDHFQQRSSRVRITYSAYCRCAND